MPTIFDLGKKVKLKYPGIYNDLSDDELGRRVKLKYPTAYNDFNDIQPRKKTLSDKIIKVGNVAGKGLESVAKFTGIKSAVDLVGTAAKGFSYGAERLMGKSPVDALKAVGEKPSTDVEKITAAKGLGAGIKNIAGNTIENMANVAGLKGVGVVGSLGRKILTNIGLGAAISGGSALSENAKPSEIVKASIAGAGVGGALPIAGAGLSAIGKQISQLPARFVNSALSRSKAEILQDIAKDKVDDFAKYVVENKPMLKTANTLLNESRSSVESLGNKISDALESAIRKTGDKTTVGLNNFLNQISKLPEAEGALLKGADIKAIAERLAPQTKKLLLKPSLTLTEANKLRQLIDKTLGDRAFLGGQLTSDKLILKKFADNLRETVKQKAPEGTRALFAELSNEIRFRDGLLDRIAKRGGNQVLSFGDFIGGGLGGVFGGGIGGAVAGVAARRVIESVPFKLTSAKVINALSKVSPILDSLAPVQQMAILNLFAEIFSPDQEEKK